MDSAFNLLTSLYCTKYYEEQIVEKLRDIHSDWKVHYEELIVEEEKPKENDQEPKEEDLKAIDELLAKAEKIISQVSIGSSRSSLGTARRSTGLSIESAKKPPQAKSDIKPARIESKLPSRPSLTNLSRPTTASKPVYMNAPYRTESIPNTFRRSKSVVSGFGDKSTPKQQISEIKTDSERRLTDLKSSSRSSIGEQRSTDSTPKIQTVEKRIRFGEMAPTLCLPSRYSNLSAENSKLTESLNNELKSRKNAGRNSFIEKFNETCLPKTSVYENCLNFDRMTMMYKRASLFLDQYYLTIKSEQKAADSKHQNLVSLFKLKIMAKKSNEFKQVIDELFSYEREKFKLNSKSNLDLKSAPPIDLLSLESMENNSLIMKKVPYEKVDDLKEFVEAKCNLIELRFNKILVNYLEKKFIDEILRNEKRFKEPDFAQYVNLIFAIILGKRTIIVK